MQVMEHTHVAPSGENCISVTSATLSTAYWGFLIIH